MNLALVFSVIALLLLIPDAYVVFGVMKGVSWWLRGLFLLPTLIYFLTVFRLFVLGKINQRMMNLVIWLTLCIVFPVLIFSIISIIGKILGILNPAIYHIFNWTALGFAVVWIVGALYGILYEWKNVAAKHLTLKFNSLPENFVGYKIVQLSDFHIGTYLSAPDTVEKIVTKVNSLKPDLIVFTGDLVNNSPEEIDPFLDTLKNLKAKDGVISVLGNHDYCLYRTYMPPETPEKETEKVVSMEEKAGWRVLRNQSVVIKRANEEISIIGVENAGGKHFTDKSDLRKAKSGLPANIFKILLSHDPSHWRREVLSKSDIDLTLAGHTHGMQFRIGNFSPAKWAYKEWGGIYKEGNQVLVVSTGTGGNVAFRFGIRPQILELTLSK